jgi:hypothetical protein
MGQMRKQPTQARRSVIRITESLRRVFGVGIFYYRQLNRELLDKIDKSILFYPENPNTVLMED